MDGGDCEHPLGSVVQGARLPRVTQQEPCKMGSCFSANKKHVRTNRQSYNGTQKIVGGNIMQNMTLEYDEVF